MMKVNLTPRHLEALAVLLERPCAGLGFKVPIVEEQRRWAGIVISQTLVQAYIECHPVTFEIPEGDQLQAFQIGGAMPGRWITEFADPDVRLEMPLGYCNGQWFYNPILCEKSE